VAAGRYDPGHVKYDADYTLSHKPDLIANWIGSRLDLGYGLTREKYEKAGYRIGFLVYAADKPPVQPIIDAEGMDEGRLQQWVAQGFDYAILVRSP
jgi:hypothetical protein